MHSYPLTETFRLLANLLMLILSFLGSLCEHIQKGFLPQDSYNYTDRYVEGMTSAIPSKDFTAGYKRILLTESRPPS